MLQFLIPLFIICVTYCYLRLKRPLGAAPGPFKFPFLGNFPQMMIGSDKNGPSTLFSNWTKHYGPIFSTDFASYPAVIINDARLIREAFANPQLCGRSTLPGTLVRMGNDGKHRGLIFNNGQSWTDQRRFTIQHLKDFGIGKNTMESIILDEVQDLIATFRKELGVPISTQTTFNIAIINSIWAIIAGERFQHDDPKLNKLVSCVIQNLAETGAAGGMIFLPKLSQMFPKLSGWSTYLESFQVTHAFMEDFVQSRLGSHKDGRFNDFTAAYIENINKMENSSSSFYKQEGVKNLICLLEDMFSAGGETTSTTLTWFLLCLAVNPEVQHKFHTEIDCVIGTGRLPSLSDRPRMPYTEAVISEVLRMSSVVPLGVFHCCLQDTLFHNFFIAKNTVVIANIRGVHHDPLLWGDPQCFRPERFLSPDEQSLRGHDALLPFSTGKRVCLGESLAKDQLFLITTTIFQAFEINPDPSAPLPSMSPHINGIVAKAQPHKLIFLARE